MKKAKGHIIIIIILALLTLGLSGYIVYDKIISKKFVPNSNQGVDNKNNNGNSLVSKYDGVLEWVNSSQVVNISTTDIVKISDGKLQCTENLQKSICEPSMSLGQIKGISTYAVNNGNQIYLLTLDNKVYGDFCLEESYDDICSFDQILNDYKIINMSKPVINYSRASYKFDSLDDKYKFYQKDVYFLTEDDRVISSNENTYEEENRDFKGFACTQVFSTDLVGNLCIYYNKDNNISYRIGTRKKMCTGMEECSIPYTLDYKPLKDEQGNIINAKSLYMYYEVNNGEKSNVIIIDKNDNLYIINYSDNGLSIKNNGQIVNINIVNTDLFSTVEFDLVNGTKYSINVYGIDDSYLNFNS